MRIALTLLSGLGYGGATYFRNVLPALADVDVQNEYHCFVPEGHPLMAGLRQPNVVFHEVMRSQTSALERLRYEQIALPRELRRLRADLLYTAKNIAVFRAPCPQVIAIRNMEPFRYREFENAWRLDAQSRIKWELTKRSINLAAGIVAVSQAVRDAIIERFPNATGKVSVVYNGNPIGQVFSVRGQVSAQSYLLTASKFVAYANQLALVEGYARLVAKRSDVPTLWFAGGIHDQRYYDRVRDRVAVLGLGDRVRFLGLVPQGKLHDLMRYSTAFLFPSMLESCPHTLLEAMACGVPIATSDVPPMPEICGDAAIYFNPRNAEEIATTIAHVFDDAALCERLVAAGSERVKQFTWEKTACGLLEAFTHIGHSALIRS
ncbi:glycosyltransferase family 4 protein [Candidatus Uhrbacteria bacterium]|nr:glycosyltransferase family 4 protein [Candidatus Uhrbacteria bacterium]